MEWQPIRSSNMWRLAYAPDRHILYVQFRSGYAYAYFGVPLTVYEGLLASQPHPWSRWGRTIQHNYRCERIAGAA